jgi:hypothetical protein
VEASRRQKRDDDEVDDDEVDDEVDDDVERRGRRWRDGRSKVYDAAIARG